MTQETELPALPEPRRYGLLRPDGSIDESLIGSRADCEYWTRAEKEEQSGWEIVGIYTEHDMRAAVLAERERQRITSEGVDSLHKRLDEIEARELRRREIAANLVPIDMTASETARQAADEIERLRLELRKAAIKLRDRAHPASEPRDAPEVLASAGFWPDCGCGECYAIHCLGNALAQLAERDRDAERYRWLRDVGDNTWTPLMKRGPAFAVNMDAAIDAAMAPKP